NPILDRSEKRSDGPEQKHGDVENRERGCFVTERIEPEPDNGNESNSDFHELETLRDTRFVEAVGHLAAESGQEEVRRNDRCRHELGQSIGGRTGNLEYQQEYQRILEKIVAECGKELAPEQGREAPGQKKRG